MTQLEESPYGESGVIIWNNEFFIVLHSWAELSEITESTRLENINLYRCRESRRGGIQGRTFARLITTNAAV